jgi:hypothetical protein
VGYNEQLYRGLRVEIGHDVGGPSGRNPASGVVAICPRWRVSAYTVPPRIHKLSKAAKENSIRYRTLLLYLAERLQF